MADLHSALKTTVTSRLQGGSTELVIVRLQQGRDYSTSSLHARPFSFSTYGIQIPDLLAQIGFQRSPCSFVTGGECFAKAVPNDFDDEGFAKSFPGIFEAGRDAERRLETCGYRFAQPEGWGFFSGRPARGATWQVGTSGDAHTSPKSERLKDSEDDNFNFSLTWIEGGGDKGWTIHIRPKHYPASIEVQSAFEFLGIKSFSTCPEFDFEPCAWRFIPFESRDDGAWDSNARSAHAAFDAHAENFSVGIEKLLGAQVELEAFQMSILPNMRPPRARSDATMGQAVRQPEMSAPTRSKDSTSTEYEYDVALSFAGTERALAAALAEAVRGAGYAVFYDDFYPEQLWGKDLIAFFDEIYRKKSRYCVMFISAEYAHRMWTNSERQSAQARALEEKGKEYILPIRVDDTELPGMPPTVGHLSLLGHSIEKIGSVLIAKLSG